MPPTGEHADDAEPRPNLPDAAPALAELSVGDLLELVLAGREEHPLEPDAVLLLLPSARFEGAPCGAKLVGELIAEHFELGEPEEARPPAELRDDGRADLDAAVREGGDLDVAEVALEAGDLLRERVARRTLVGPSLRSVGRGRSHIAIRLGEIEQRHLRGRA